MSKVRVNFFLPDHLYNEIQKIAEIECTSSADIFRKAVKGFIISYREDDFNKVFLEEKQESKREVINERSRE